MFQYTNYDGWDGLYNHAVALHAPSLKNSNLLCCPEMDKIVRSAYNPNDISHIADNFLKHNSYSGLGCPIYKDGSGGWNLALTERGWALDHNGRISYAKNTVPKSQQKCCPKDFVGTWLAFDGNTDTEEITFRCSNKKPVVDEKLCTSMIYIIEYLDQGME